MNVFICKFTLHYLRHLVTLKCDLAMHMTTTASTIIMARVKILMRLLEWRKNVLIPIHLVLSRVRTVMRERVHSSVMAWICGGTVSLSVVGSSKNPNTSRIMAARKSSRLNHLVCTSR